MKANTARFFSALVLTLTASATAAAAEGGGADATTAPATSTAAEAGDSAAAPDVAAQANLKTEKHEEDAASGATDEPKEQAPKPQDKEAGEDDTYGHGMQVGIRAGIGFGYKMDFRYEHSPLCTDFDNTKKVSDQQKICGFGASPATEVALSFALLDSVEPYVFGRFGLSGESKTNTQALELVGVGARLYTMSDSRFKMFVEPALAYELEGGAGSPSWSPPGLDPSYKQDLLFHVGIGPQYDFAKAFGMYLNGAVDVGVLRAISATLAVNIGAQIRFP